MPLFRYTIINDRGKETEMTGEFSGLPEAAATLRNQGKLVLSMEEAGAEKAGVKDPLQLSFLDYFSSVRKNDIVLFFRQLATLIVAGITLSNALIVLEKQAAKRRLSKIIGTIRRDIEGGSTFQKALMRYPRIFDSLVIGMVNAGEIGGMLDVLLDRIATYLEDRAAFRTQVVSSFIYPAIVIVMSVLVISFLVGFVIPKFIPIIKGMGGTLPWNTQFIIDLTDWFKIYGKHLFAGLGIFVAILVLSYKYIEIVRYWVDRLKLKIPIFGCIFSYSMVVQFSENLSILIRSGINLAECLLIVRDAVGNHAAKAVITTMERVILRGESLSRPLRDANSIFPLMVADMVAVGEETGNMDTTLELSAGIYKKMLTTYVKRMNSMIEPVLIIVLGGIVGFVAWALIAGVLAMYGKVG